MRGILKIVKYNKGSALNSRLFFFTLCTEMGAKHTRSLFHTDVRWLSKGRVVTWVYELRDETHAFLTEKLSPLASSFSDEKWLLTLFYLADIFSVLNKLNLKLQGREDNIFRHCEQTQAFQKPLKLWQLWLKTSSYYMFPMKQTEENGVSKKSVADLKCLIQSHLDVLMGNFSHYFPPGEDQCIKRQVVGEKSLWLWNSKFDYWTEFNSFWIIRNAATNLWRHVEKNPQKTPEKLSSFWIGLSTEYPILSKASISFLPSFTTADETMKQTECDSILNWIWWCFSSHIIPQRFHGIFASYLKIHGQIQFIVNNEQTSVCPTKADKYQDLTWNNRNDKRSALT